MGRSAAKALLLTALALAGLDGAAWLLTCQLLENGFRQATADLRTQGWILSAGAPRRSGWPFAAELRWLGVAIAADPALLPSPLSWQAARLRVRLGWAHPRTVLVDAGGEQELRIDTLAPIPFRARRLRLALPLDGDAPRATAAALVVDAPGGPLTIGSATVELSQAAVEADAGPIAFPRGPVLRSLRLAARLTQPLPAEGSAAPRARAWQAAGGAVALSDIALRWGALGATGQGTLGLDAGLQPEGALAFEVTGLAPALDEFAASGLIPAGAAMAAKAVATILAGPTPGSAVRLPVRIRDGVLEVARFPLLRLPRLQWAPS